MTANRSSEELRMREIIVPELRKRYPTARIIHELSLRYSSNRIDLAAVTDTEIISVEIKSSKDVLTRLEAQLRAFKPISTRLIVALAPKWNERLPSLVTESKSCTSYTPQFTPTQQILQHVGTSHMEVWTVDAAAGSIEVTDRAYRDNMPWLARMLHMLHVAELADIAARYRVWSGKRPVHLDLVRQCVDMMTGREIVGAVCRALRERDAFAHGTDEPTNLAAKPACVVAAQVGLSIPPNIASPTIPAQVSAHICGCRCHRDPDDVARKLLKHNAGRVHKTIIAAALNRSVEWLERFAARCNPPFDLTTPREREDEPRGA